METSHLKVLLLGWDDTHLYSPPVPAALFLARNLVAHTDLTVVLPQLPEDANDDTTHVEGASVTGLGNISLAQHQSGLAQLTQDTPQRTTWQAPAAPYLGATPAPAPGTENAPIASTAALAPGTRAEPLEAPVNTPAPTTNSAAAASPVAAAAQPNTLPASAERSTLTHALAMLSAGHKGGAGLNFRVIQYARFATPLVSGQPFEVIYAADWPTWLAALEIRQRTGCPLVLHVHSLAADRNTADDRGWIQELERLALRRADLVLAASETLAHRVHTQFKIPRQRIRVQPVSLSPELVAEAIVAVLGEAAAQPA